MTIYSQPNAKVFAEDAPSSEIADFKAWARGLGIAFDETNGHPQMEGFNGLLNALSQYIKYLEQRGIPMWRADLEYPVDARVIYNSLEYRCISQNTNAQPDLNQTSWSLEVVDSLTSTATSQPLSANQGRVISSMLSSSSNGQQIGSNMIKWTRKKGFSLGNSRVSFETPFPNNCFFCIAVNSTDGNNSSHSVITYPPTRDGFTVSIRQGYNSLASDLTDITYIAIGN
jgi:hypothetical protein